MRANSTLPQAAPYPQPLARLFQAGLALAGGAALFVILLFSLALGYDLMHAGRIYPGVSVAGVDVSGMSMEKASVTLAQRLSYPVTGKIVLEAGGRMWQAAPAELGLMLDAQNSARAAYQVGRSGGPFRRLAEQFQSWYSGRDLPPLLVFDQRAGQRYLNSVAALIDRPTIEAALQVNGAEVSAQPGQIGRRVDVPATLAALEIHLRTLKDSLVPLVVVETPPGIMDAAPQAEAARRILSQPLTLQIAGAGKKDPGPWTFDRAALASMLVIERVEDPQGARFQVGVDASRMRAFLEELSDDLQRIPEDARFIFNDDTKKLEVIEPAIIGRSLNVEATLQAVQQSLPEARHSVDLVFDIQKPAVTDDMTAESLGIREAVSVQKTYFYGSSASRMQNIKTAAARFHGLMVPPGATFSMAEILGDVSLDTGYAEALIIYGNRTIKGVGGGVCQVSTTLFRTVFFGGYPIVERHPHAYRVSYYELAANGNIDPDMVGLDATVFVPVVDFKFVNDTPNWLLMETYFSAKAQSLTWKFYSTSDGRRVEWATSGLENIESPPDPVYQENPDLGVGEIRQVDWEAAGADVFVNRTVYRDGQVYFQDQVVTHYMPWRAVYEYGPGTRIPKKYRSDE